ncbi:CidA/LrgA family protein [Staphylococcus aureus]|nr:CidA/LrgA family protein [Staphylococcus aureus]
MHKVQLIIKLLLQLGIIIVITYIGTEIQKIFHLPLAGSIVGLFLFYLLLQFKIVPLTWVEDGANFLLKTMVFFAVIIIGTCIVALSSGYIAEKMSVKHKQRKGIDAYE